MPTSRAKKKPRTMATLLRRKAAQTSGDVICPKMAATVSVNVGKKKPPSVMA